MASEKIEITKDSLPDFVNTFGTFHDSFIDEIRWQLTGRGSDDSVSIDITLGSMEAQPKIRLTLDNAFEIFLLKADRHTLIPIGRMEINIQDDHMVLEINKFHPIEVEKPLRDFPDFRHFKCHSLWWEYL